MRNLNEKLASSMMRYSLNKSKGFAKVNLIEYVRLFARYEQVIKINQSRIILQHDNIRHYYLIYDKSIRYRINQDNVTVRLLLPFFEFAYLFDANDDQYIGKLDEYLPVAGDLANMQHDDYEALRKHTSRIKDAKSDNKLNGVRTLQENKGLVNPEIILPREIYEPFFIKSKVEKLKWKEKEKEVFEMGNTPIKQSNDESKSEKKIPTVYFKNLNLESEETFELTKLEVINLED